MPSRKGKKRGTRSAKKPTRGRQNPPVPFNSSDTGSIPSILNPHQTPREQIESRNTHGTQVGNRTRYSMTKDSLNDPTLASNTEAGPDVSMIGTSKVFAAGSTGDFAANSSKGKPYFIDVPNSRKMAQLIPQVNKNKAKRKAKVWPTRRHITRSKDHFDFDHLPLELLVKIIRLAVPKRVIWIRHENGEWAAGCDAGPPAVLYVCQCLRNTLIDFEFHNVQPPKEIRIGDRPLKNTVYFSPQIDDIVFDLGDGPGADRLLHWVKKSCLHRIERIAVLRDNDHWDKDFYFEELALGLRSLGKVKSLIFQEDVVFSSEITIHGHHPGGKEVTTNGTYLLGTAEYMGEHIEVKKWMNVKGHSEIPELSQKELPPVFNDWGEHEWTQVEFTINEWKPNPDGSSNGWGRDSEIYHGGDLLDMWFARVKGENPQWEAPKLFTFRINPTTPMPIDEDLCQIPDSRCIRIWPLDSDDEDDEESGSAESDEEDDIFMFPWEIDDDSGSAESDDEIEEEINEDINDNHTD